MKTLILLLLTTLTALFIGCGGGGSDNNNTQSGLTTPNGTVSTYDYNSDGGATLPLSATTINTRKEVATHLERLKNNKEAFNTYINIFVLNLLNLDKEYNVSEPIKKDLSSKVLSYAPTGEQQKMIVNVINGNIDYSSYTLKGDVNNDYSVDMKDVNALINAIYNGYTSSSYDVNSDGLVNLDDLIFTTARLLSEIKYFDFYTVDGEKLAIETRDTDMPKTFSYAGDNTKVMVVAKDINMASSFESGLSDIDNVWYKQDGWEASDITVTKNTIIQSSTKTAQKETVFEQRDVLKQVVEEALRTSADNEYLCGWNFYTHYIYKGNFLEQDKGISGFDGIFSNVEKTIKSSFAKAEMGNPPHKLYHTEQRYAYEAGQRIGKDNEVKADRIAYKNILISEDGTTVRRKYYVEAYSLLFISQAIHTISGTVEGNKPFKGELTLHRDGPGKEDNFDINVNGQSFTRNNLPYGEYSVNAKTACGCEAELSTRFIFDDSTASVSISNPDDTLGKVYLSLDVKDKEQKRIVGAQVEIIADECAAEAFSNSAITDSNGNVRFENLDPANYKVFVNGKLTKTIHMCANTNTVVNVGNPLWKFHATYTSSARGSGSMTIKKFTMDIDKINESLPGAPGVPAYIVHVGNDYQSYPENTTISYSGLAYNPDLAPLLVTSDGVDWHALTSDEPFWMVGSYSGSSDMDCSGILPADFESKVKAGESISWTSGKYGTSCSFLFEPCQNEACD